MTDSEQGPRTVAPASAATRPETVFATVYSADDVASIAMEAAVGEPGSYPFTRGIYREMYQRRLWTMRQYAGFSDAAESNQRYRYLLAQGTSGLSVAWWRFWRDENPGCASPPADHREVFDSA